MVVLDIIFLVLYISLIVKFLKYKLYKVKQSLGQKMVGSFLIVAIPTFMTLHILNLIN